MSMVKKIFRKITEYCPLPALILYLLGIISGIFHFISTRSTAFSDFFNYHISSAVRCLLAKITNIFPFSVAETILIFLPVIIGLLVYGSIKFVRAGDLPGWRYVFSLMAAITLFYTIFVFGFATGYQGSTLEAKLNIDRRKVSAEELGQTAEILAEKVQALLDDIKFEYGASSIMPYSLDEMNRRLNDAYRKAAQKYQFVQSFQSKVKYVMLSEPMTYTHISGVYTYYTGEANINVNFPDYTIPFTAAHELSHQRGIAREDEANFMAFLVCMESDDPYIQYSGYENMLEYILNAFYTADPDAYNRLLDSIDMRVRCEMIAYSEFFDKYRDSAASQVSQAVNDTFLKSQGQSEGTKSYGRVVDLAVAYYIPIQK